MLARRSPVSGHPLDLRTEMDRLFDRFFEGKFFEPFRAEGAEPAAWAPALDISERPDSIIVTADVPGVPADRIDVTVADGVLTIRGDRDETKSEKGENFHRVERSYGSFLRRVALPTAVDDGKVNAAMKDGVLTVELKKSAVAQPRRIPVKASAS